MNILTLFHALIDEVIVNAKIDPKPPDSPNKNNIKSNVLININLGSIFLPDNFKKIYSKDNKNPNEPIIPNEDVVFSFALSVFDDIKLAILERNSMLWEWVGDKSWGREKAYNSDSIMDLLGSVFTTVIFSLIVPSKGISKCTNNPIIIGIIKNIECFIGS